jgi:hypothetical protein
MNDEDRLHCYEPPTNVANLPKTYILDLDGTCWCHRGTLSEMYKDVQILDNVREKIDEWCGKGHYIVLLSARPEGMRRTTERQLEELRIPYHQLVLGAPIGQRILVNDRKPNSTEDTAIGITVERDAGLGEVP